MCDTQFCNGKTSMFSKIESLAKFGVDVKQGHFRQKHTRIVGKVVNFLWIWFTRKTRFLRNLAPGDFKVQVWKWRKLGNFSRVPPPPLCFWWHKISKCIPFLKLGAPGFSAHLYSLEPFFRVEKTRCAQSVADDKDPYRGSTSKKIDKKPKKWCFRTVQNVSLFRNISKTEFPKFPEIRKFGKCSNSCTNARFKKNLEKKFS